MVKITECLCIFLPLKGPSDHIDLENTKVSLVAKHVFISGDPDKTTTLMTLKFARSEISVFELQ